MVVLTFLFRLIEFFVRILAFIFFYIPIFLVTIIMVKCGASSKQVTAFLDFFFDRDWEALKIKVKSLCQRIQSAYLRLKY